MDERQLFEDIIRGQELRDEGIVSHDAGMLELEREIRSQYVDKGFTEIPVDELDVLQKKANERWPYFGEIATLSGCIAADYDEDEETLAVLVGDIAIPDTDGEIVRRAENGEGLYYFSVTGAKLRSAGVVIDPVTDEDGKLCDVHVGYVFYHLTDHNEEVPLFARPDMLDRHNYDIPTPTEARVRLEHKWPAQLELIDSFVGMKEALPRRLVMIEESLKEELADQIFRELVELYLNDELDLHMVLPYMIIVENSLDCLEDVDEEDSLWYAVNIEGALTIFLQAPEIRFSSVTDEDFKTPKAYLFGKIFNDADGDKPEMVAIAAENIERFYSTSARDSIAARAIASMDRDIERDMQTLVQGVSIVKFADVEQDDNTPEYIHQLEILEEAFTKVQRLSDEFRMHTFATYDDAKRDATILLEKIREYLNETIFSRGSHLIEAMGERIALSNLRYNLQWVEGENALLHGADKDKPVIELPLGDKIVGDTDQLYAGVESVFASEEDEQVIFYIPHVVMGVIISEETGMTVDSEPVLSQLISRNQAAVPLDSSSDIRLIGLEQYRASQLAIQQAQDAYGKDSPLMSRIRLLEQAFQAEDPDGFTNLDASVMSRFTIDLGRAVRRHRQPTKPAAAFLESMLADRNILAVSDVYERTSDGHYRLDDNRTGKLQGWKIVDIQASENGEEVFMFAMSRNNEEHRYLPLSSVEDFRF